MNIQNQKPVVISPIYNAPANGQFNPVAVLQATIADPLFAPFMPNHPVTITDNGNPVTPDIIAQNLTDCLGDTVQTASENWCRNLFRQTLLSYDTSPTLNMQDLFASQSGAAAKLPAPSATCVYTPGSDIIPVAKKFLAGQSDYNEFFATFAYYTRANTLGFYFGNESMFDDFKNWLQAQTAMLSNVFPVDTNQMMQDFLNNIHLSGLTESLMLRNNDSENNHDNSFARVIIAMLMNYAQTITNTAEFGVLPFAAGELFCPRSIVFINVDKHAKATPQQVSKEWDIIRQSLAHPVHMISNSRLTSLTAMQRHLKKVAGAAASAASNNGQGTGRAAMMRFRKTPPGKVDIVRCIKKIMGKMAQVNRSLNSYKNIHMTYQRPNRRDPDDFNKPGKSVSTRYKPDLHVYIDTSGSISEENYQGAIKACIQLAKKLNVSLYFNSFSHTLSQCTKLHTQDKNLSDIYKEFQRVPKVTGGTDYEQIWNYINCSKRRRRELSLIITDFEWTPGTQFVEHPKNLYYMPCSGIDWHKCVQYAGDFAQAMTRNEPNIRAHILM